MIYFTLLGTSALMPLPDRALSAAALFCGGRGILFDCGEGTQTAARRAGISLLKTELIALTHYHGDHIFGLPGLLQTMFSLGRTQPLYITGPAGLERELAPIIKLAGFLSYELRFFEMPDGELKLDSISPAFPSGASLSSFETAHRVASQGYCFTLKRAGKFLPEKATELNIPIKLWSRLQKGESVEAEGTIFTPSQVLGEGRRGLKLVFTGDTSSSSAIIKAASDADLVVCDATYGEDEQAELALSRGHMNFAMAAQTAAAAGARRLWLTHYSQLIEEPEEYLGNAARLFPQTECGFDGKEILLKFDE